ncbi:MAG: hypothetical protein KBT19_06560 [Lachnospiraceae bacterium]|nr:hypothetical protein [Candidatus Colinaster equi]
MRISKEHMETMRKQIELDCNLKEAYKLKDDIYLAPTKVLQGSRKINKMDPFFRVVVFMGTAYVMADEEMLPGWEEILKDYPAEWFFNFGRLRKIDRILNEYGREIVDTHIFFLPDEDAKYIETPKEYMWYSKDDIEKMRENNRFHNALCYSPTQPDVIAVGAPDISSKKYDANHIDLSQETLKGMAGASNDGEYVWQIGIDVAKEYRNEGLAVKLTTAIKQEIVKKGKLPFYGTGEAHALSRTVAIKSGFLPAFAEIYVAKIEDKVTRVFENDV